MLLRDDIAHDEIIGSFAVHEEQAHVRCHYEQCVSSLRWIAIGTRHALTDEMARLAQGSRKANHLTRRRVEGGSLVSIWGGVAGESERGGCARWSQERLWRA